MLYKFAKSIMSAALRIFYRRIYVTGLETIPTRGPAILISNHTSSLMDAAIIGILIKRPVHSFARGDIFVNLLAAKTLSALKMIPVHNHTARGSLQTNSESFVKAQQLLTSQVILYFPEGHSHIERTLHTFRKGVFRLAFQAASRYEFRTELSVIPVGINYSHPTAYQADVTVNIGTPLIISNYKDAYKVSPSAALLRLTRDSYVALQQEVLHIDNASNYSLAERCLSMKRNDYSSFTNRWIQRTHKRSEEEKAVCVFINQLPPAQLASLQSKLDRYFHLLEKYQLHDAVISPACDFSPVNGWMLAAGLPLFVTGYLLNALPLITARRIADKKVYRVDYYSWVFAASAAFMHVIWLGALVMLYAFIGWQFAAVILVMALGSGAFALQYTKWWKTFRMLRGKNRLVRRYPGVLLKLQGQRQAIIAMIDANTVKAATIVNV